MFYCRILRIHFALCPCPLPPISHRSLALSRSGTDGLIDRSIDQVRGRHTVGTAQPWLKRCHVPYCYYLVCRGGPWLTMRIALACYQRHRLRCNLHPARHYHYHHPSHLLVLCAAKMEECVRGNRETKPGLPVKFKRDNWYKRAIVR
jgi:hypothetical protein